MPHRLPLRRRPIRSPDAPEVGDSACTAVPSTSDCPGTTVTPELIQELVQNGSLAPHFLHVHDLVHRPGWQHRKHIQTEIEFGSVLAEVQAPPVDGGPNGTKCSEKAAQQVPLLLRVFRKPAGSKDAGHVIRSWVQHALCGGHQSLDTWAPVAVMHVVRALAATGLHLYGPSLCHQRVQSQAILVDGQQRVVARRERTDIHPEAALKTVVNWKVKYTVPVVYPGNQTDSMQIAWELDEAVDAPRSGILLQDAQQRNLILQEAVPTGPIQENIYVKLQWLFQEHHPVWDIALQLGFTTSASLSSPEAFRTRLLQTPRPWMASEVPGWLTKMGADTANWRIEVELRPPYTCDGITQGLYLHHLIGQITMSQSVSLPRSQFVMLYKKHLDHATNSNVSLAKHILASYCDEHGIPSHRRTGYPIQPRPHDLVARDVAKLHECVATPKADGREAFLVAHCHGHTIVFRDGQAIHGAWKTPRVVQTLFPVILEGEWMADGIFLAYDCALTPAAAYARKGRYHTRHTAMLAVTRRLRDAGVPCFAKPMFPVGINPQLAIRRCLQWSQDANVPCDGVVFVSNQVIGYGTLSRLWKVKHVPTIDFSVHRAFDDVYELMLRSSQGTVQSLHRFRDDRCEYVLPVLLQPPVGVQLCDGDVVELGIQVQRDAVARVSFPTMHVRESGKSPNYLLGGMDLTANAMNVSAFLRPECPFLMRILLRGAVREARNAFLSYTLSIIQPCHVMEIGGGCGGDASVWVGTPNLEIVDVIEPDREAVAEYKRRLMDRFDGTPHRQTVVLADGQRFRFHALPLFDINPSVARQGCDVAVLYFSISQIVSNDTDIDALLAGLFLSRGIPNVVIGMHDHTVMGLPPQDSQVSCTVLQSSGCSRHPMVCECVGGNGRTARLQTTITGSAMANGIEENVFALDRFLQRVEAFQQRRSLCVRTWWPYRGTPSAHWLLGTMVFVWLSSVTP